jgi:hypothetical protein
VDALSRLLSLMVRVSVLMACSSIGLSWANFKIASVYILPLRSHFVILAKAGIQCSCDLLDPPVKPEDDKT